MLGKGRECIVCSFEFVMIVGIYSLFILYDEFTSHVGTVGDTCIDTSHYVGFKKKKKKMTLQLSPCVIWLEINFRTHKHIEQHN